MKQQIRAIQAELIKVKHSYFILATFVAFGIAPIMGAVFTLILQDSEALEKAGGLAAKAKAMDFEANWRSYIDLLTQAVGVGGVLVFGFVASWIFGREYSDGTAKDLLSLPTPRTKILNAKFLLYGFWCVALVLSNLLVGLLLGTILQLSMISTDWLALSLTDYFITTILTIIVGVPIAFFALYGKGYLAPLGFVALTLVFSQVIAATGYGTYFPWSVPGLYSGAGGEYKNSLDNFSYTILIMTCIAGYFATTIYWKLADQTK
ncbi:ABC transporter permease [Aquiflexum sp.]|uniref:ABC transporter permease n=1 Tax=Aquiflexum sp. TaxID=1872584 RepID=UPI003593E4E7